MPELLGTAREAWEMRGYRNLKEKYGDVAAQAIIGEQLRDAGISSTEFNSYLGVKHKVQNGALSVGRARKEAEAMGNDFLCDVLG